jgi:hypothetical protein
VEEQENPKQRHTRDRAAFGWSQRLKRVFSIDPQNRSPPTDLTDQQTTLF